MLLILFAIDFLIHPVETRSGGFFPRNFSGYVLMRC